MKNIKTPNHTETKFSNSNCRGLLECEVNLVVLTHYMVSMF